MENFTAKYEENGSITAGPMEDGQTYSGITEASRFYATVMALTNDGADIDPYVPPTAPPVDVVSARQFKLQLLASGLLDQVDAWIASQSKAVQIAYEYSGTFVRTEPMMAAGFAAMGFTEEQIDGFFTAASQL